jgi:cell cycle sensor histidine kinase DivJ
VTDAPTPSIRTPARRWQIDSAVGWHGAAAALCLLALAAHWWWFVGGGNRALAAMLLPAVAGLWLARGGAGGAWRQPLLVGLWALAGGFASVWTGGVTGPLGVWCLAPLAAAAALGTRRPLALGATLAAVTAGVVTALQAAHITTASPTAGDTLWLGAGAMAVMGVGIGAAMILSNARARREIRQTTLDLRQRAGASDRWADLVRSQPQMLLTIDGAARVLDVTGAAVEGLDETELRHQGLLPSVAQGDRGRVDLAIASAVLSSQSQVSFAPNSAADRWLEAAIRRLGDGRLLVAVADRTSEHARQASLEQARAEAENLNASKSRFLANMSHELRTPLNAIIGFSDVMRTGMFGALTPKYAEYAGLIHESGGHLLDLISDVLDMSKIEAERFELSREEFDAREAISAALRLMRLQADGAGVALRGVLPSEPLLAYADRRAMRQITLNLVSNALKFTGRGGSVTVSLRAQGEMLELSVADTGLGIASEDLARLGRPFEQAGEAQQRTQGTGLGLSLVRAFAELHGGVMSIESTLGEGTAVTVRMPVLLAIRTEPPPAEPEPVSASATPDSEPDPPPFPPSDPGSRRDYPSNVIAFDPRR